jgi:four helix bundle protein
VRRCEGARVRGCGGAKVRGCEGAKVRRCGREGAIRNKNCHSTRTAAAQKFLTRTGPNLESRDKPAIGKRRLVCSTLPHDQHLAFRGSCGVEACGGITDDRGLLLQTAGDQQRREISRPAQRRRRVRPRNIAEGFGRFHHPEFARFARIAKGSEQEVLNHLYRARTKGYITPAEFDDGAHAARKALKAVNGLIRYLESTPEFGKR